MECLTLLLILSLIPLPLCFMFFKHCSRFSGPNLPPGRIGFPIIGETFEFLSHRWHGHPEKFVSDRVQKFKTQVFKTCLLGHPMVVFNGPAGNKFLFSNENKLVRVWWPDSIHKLFPSSQHTDSSGEEALKLRMMLPQFLRPEALRQYIGVMDDLCQKIFDMTWKNKEEITVLPLTRRFTFWIACRLFLSMEDPNHVARFANQFNLLEAGIISVPINFPGTPFWKAIKASELIRKEIVAIISERKRDLAEGKATPTQDVLSHMLTISDGNGKLLSELVIADMIVALLIAGHDTSSLTCTFIMKFLAELPHVYEEAYKEQMEIAKSKAPGELLNWNDIQKMKYSWNVACEVLRLTPPIQGTFREAINDFIFNGFSIPKGWKLYWTVSTHKSAEHFPDPERFEPARFEGRGPAPCTYVPFGGGPRMCPGREFARLEILVFMHNLLKRYQWKKVLQDEKTIVDFATMPEKGLPVRLIPHQDAS